MGKVCTDPKGNGLRPVCQSVQVRDTVQEKGMYRLSGQWTTPSMPVSLSQGDSPREWNMGKVCTGSRAMDFTQFASQFESGRQSKRKEHEKGKYRPSGR